jgi:hypothetical protein
MLTLIWSLHIVYMYQNITVYSTNMNNYYISIKKKNKLSEKHSHRPFRYGLWCSAQHGQYFLQRQAEVMMTVTTTGSELRASSHPYVNPKYHHYPISILQPGTPKLRNLPRPEAMR